MQNSRKIKLRPCEKFAIDLFRTDGGIDSFVESTGIAKVTVNSWISDRSEPSKHKRAFIEKKFPVMKSDDWKREHVYDLSVSETTYILSVRLDLQLKEFSDKIKIATSVLSRLLMGFEKVSEPVKEKVAALSDAVFGKDEENV